jgi:hypothetical protein
MRNAATIYLVTFKTKDAPSISVDVAASSREEAIDKARAALRRYDKSEPGEVIAVEAVGPASVGQSRLR